MHNHINHPQSNHFNKSLEASLAKYDNSSMGPKGVLRLWTEASKSGQPLKFANEKQEGEFLLGVEQLTRVIRDLFEKLRNDLIFSEGEEYSNDKFYEEYRKKTGTPYKYPESRLAAYGSIISSFGDKFGRIMDMTKPSSYYNKNVGRYNTSSSITNNIITHIDFDYDYAHDKFLDENLELFKGLNKELIREFFIIMKENLPKTLPLIDASQNNTVVNNTQNSVKEALQ